ncbi:dihydroxyacetone kinase subunit DhaL [Pleomorphomonas carboxyditropha]|uniref:Dihydroxyacetone kinase subunit L n=1 Tax=Pleomorphomonas carboxyditropha TaxID=2023338 RepID=A0A2G9WTC0_9HYPH|nr:dihydroxyacetone kinase subunit DhaL [Pleomorphomonas carboxyditropha]PIO97943.1 dihydroxyacetone kinase subunit L [Pleomorphomonas carboxyditropha]
MYDTLTPSQARDMLTAVARHLVASVDMLTEVDQAIGDGDHGIGMRRGFSAVEETMAAIDPESVAKVFKAAGTAIMAKTGGAAGAVFGTLFRAGSAAFEERPVLDAAGFAAFLRQGLEGVEKRGGAQPGQKTMIDALAPAAAAAEAAIAGGLAEAVRQATDAAKGGVEATKGMIATTGKARTLGERSLGHPDPGAVSMSLILEAMRDYIAA